MKTTNLALIFVIIAFPMFFTNDSRIQSQRGTEKVMLQYDGALHAAVQDAAHALALNDLNAKPISYASAKDFRPNKELAVSTFYKTLFIGYGIQNDPVTQGVLKAYIPAIVLIDYDGFWIYTDETFTNAQGQNENRQVWKSKIPYAYSDSKGNSISFTLNDYVFAYEASSKSWYEGKRADVASQVSISLLQNAATFDQIRRSTIVQQIQQDLEFYINSHNEYARHYGITYTFTLPKIDQEEWENTIQDVGILAFIQGVPIGENRYNNFAFGGQHITKKHLYYGAIRNGIKIYFRDDCNFTDSVIETFPKEKDAAAKGFFPRSCLNQ